MAARDSERYYWLKLDRGFFKRHDITVIEDMPNGKDYVLFYLKLMLESVDHEGALRFSDTIPYSESMLASVTHTDIEIVRAAMTELTALGMIEIWDDKTLFMHQVAELLDSETYAAKRKREQRKEDEKGDNVPEDVRQVFEAWQSLGIQKLRKVPGSATNAGKMLRARIKEYGIGSVLEAVEIVRASDFLMGKATDFQITFDWFVKPNNFLKIVNGNYDNREKKEQSTRHGREMKETYNTIERWADQRGNDPETV